MSDNLLPVGTNDTGPYRAIIVTNIQPGNDDEIASFDVKIGGVLVRRVSLRKGRNDSTYVNFPSHKNEHGRWVHVVEITSPALDVAVRQEIVRAVSEAVR